MDDVTIEDEYDSNEDISSTDQIKTNLISSKIFEIFRQPWLILLFLSIFILIFVYINKIRRQNSNSRIVSNQIEDKYEDMQRIRERQQKFYEEQCLRHAEEKKAKLELLKSTKNEKENQLKYRSNDHNPLTGQSNRGSADSCSWKPSSKRKPAGG